jgi:hypothetical protein
VNLSPHSKTPAQRDPSDRKTQRARLLALLVEARGGWVSLPAILSLGIAQFGARILELRRTGFNIENKTERDDAGVVRSSYRLINSPVQQPTKSEDPEPITDDWYRVTTGKPRPSLDRENLFLFDRERRP